MSYLSSDELARFLDVRDLTDPAAGPHALQSLVDAVLARLSDRPHLVRAHRWSPCTTTTNTSAIPSTR